MMARIDGETLCLILQRGDDGLAHLVWFGPKSNDVMARAPNFQRLPASPDVPVGPTLHPEHGQGFHNIAQVEGHCPKTRRLLRLKPPEFAVSDRQITLNSQDESLGVRVVTTMMFKGDALVVSCCLHNEGETSIDITRAASMLIPTPDWASRVVTWAGAWGREGHHNERDWLTGRIEQLGRAGRPGFDGGPTLSLLEKSADVANGRWLSAHLAWSGAFRLAAEQATDGSGQFLAERLLAPGEIRLEPGGSLVLPETIVALSHEGSNGVSRIYHDVIRREGLRIKRLVHFNTWEARYFDVTEEDCVTLAKQAAELGAERFVLDDGWFKGRRNDETSLGDWSVDEAKFPNGLMPLINVVHAQGMDFGLWLEPEMVSPNSDLCRAHPDWVLGWPAAELATGRNQLVLDLSLPAVREHLFVGVASLLDAYPISYIKWDCNRDLYPATSGGVASSGWQTEGLYELLDRLRTAYKVQIESCASGGGRIDAGIASRTDRFWASDTTDAIDRLRVQRAASFVMPTERLGCHIGPSPNPMTGRAIPMDFRVLAALFGHMGVEANPARFTGDDKAILTRGLKIYKAHRDWMGNGQLLNLSEPGADPDLQMLVAAGGDQALLRTMRVNTPVRPLQPRIRLAGLDQQAHYELVELALRGDQMVWPLGNFLGGGLMHDGLVLDSARALTGRLIHLRKTG
jgi:alpha-galactosidase